MRARSSRAVCGNGLETPCQKWSDLPAYILREAWSLRDWFVRELSFLQSSLRVSFVSGGQRAPLDSVTRALIDLSACLVDPFFSPVPVLSCSKHVRRRVHGRRSRLSRSRAHELRCREAFLEGKVLLVVCAHLSVCSEGLTVLSSSSRLPATSPRPGSGDHVVTTVKSPLLPLRGMVRSRATPLPLFRSCISFSCCPEANLLQCLLGNSLRSATRDCRLHSILALS